MKRFVKWLLDLIDHQVIAIRVDPDGERFDKITLRRCDGKITTFQIPPVYGVEWQVNAPWLREPKQ